MPNRILKESVCTSEQIDALTPEQEVFFYRLITACDDFGLMDARPKILASRCYPLKSIDSKCIQEMLAALQVQGLVILYEVDGRPFLKMTGWEKHQQIRAKRAKYPTPEQGREITCNQVQSNVPVIQSNPIQSNDEPPEPVGSASSSDDPRKRLFDLGVQILTSHGDKESTARGFIAKHAKSDENKLAEVLGYLAANPKVEPKSYIAASMKPKERRVQF